jgi:hypothetical protein
MAKHNLKLLEDDAKETTLGFERWILPLGINRITTKFSLISRVITEHFFAQVVFIPYYNHREDREEMAMEILGRPVNLVMADYVFNFLMERTETLWLKHKPLAREKGEKGLGAKSSFINALLQGFLDKLQTAERQSQESEGLVSSALILRGDVDLSRYVNKCHTRLRKKDIRVSVSFSPFSRQAGDKAGRELSIHSPIGSGDGTTRGLLE